MINDSTFIQLFPFAGCRFGEMAIAGQARNDIIELSFQKKQGNLPASTFQIFSSNRNVFF